MRFGISLDLLSAFSLVLGLPLYIGISDLDPLLDSLNHRELKMQGMKNMRNIGKVSNIASRTQCPEERRTQARKKSNKRTWASKKWREARDRFLLENPRCKCCGDLSSVPHHACRDVYGHPEYLILSGTEAYCRGCHKGLHNGKFQCGKCGKIRAKSEGELCFLCLDKDVKERIVFNREHRQRERNRKEGEYRRAFKEKISRGV